ncbi:hypothetical protein TcWFU_001186 [Taenia crassiceps]|uniref:Uncharacterized protein n=1 Tax=Taenia crassiceps TaxID=6207 RepID=A0ABR4Q7U3_9CEST
MLTEHTNIGANTGTERQGQDVLLEAIQVLAVAPRGKDQSLHRLDSRARNLATYDLNHIFMLNRDEANCHVRDHVGPND